MALCGWGWWTEGLRGARGSVGVQGRPFILVRVWDAEAQVGLVLQYSLSGACVYNGRFLLQTLTSLQPQSGLCAVHGRAAAGPTCTWPATTV